MGWGGVGWGNGGGLGGGGCGARGDTGGLGERNSPVSRNFCIRGWGWGGQVSRLRKKIHLLGDCFSALALIMTGKNDRTIYRKQVLGRSCVFFTSFGY